MKKTKTKTILLFSIFCVLQLYPILEHVLFPYINYWLGLLIGLFMILCAFSFIFFDNQYKKIKIASLSTLIAAYLFVLLYIFVSASSAQNLGGFEYLTLFGTVMISYQLHMLLNLILIFLAYAYEIKVEAFKKTTKIYLIIFAIFYTLLNIYGFIMGTYLISLEVGNYSQTIEMILLSLPVAGQVYISIFSVFVIRSLVFSH